MTQRPQHGRAVRRARAGRGKRGGGGGEQVDGAGGRVHLLLRPPHRQAVARGRHDIAGYLFTGGVAAGSSLLAAGADLTGRPALRRTGRLGALGGLAFSMVALVHDLGQARAGSSTCCGWPS